MDIWAAIYRCFMFVAGVAALMLAMVMAAAFTTGQIVEGKGAAAALAFFVCTSFAVLVINAALNGKAPV